MKMMMIWKKLFVLLELLFSSFLVADSLSRDEFPPHFIFGSSTSAYQVEGAVDEDGRKPSVWDTFAHSDGNLFTGNGDIACDQYHKYKEDVELMAEMGLDAYRFSISWSRLIPDGRGQVNPKGLQYYNNLINELLSQGIEAHVTLVHWDIPQALEDEYGGWISRKIIKDFTAYADVCFREFGDRVKYWTTVNEGNVFAMGGYESGFLPPQHCTPSPASNCTRGNSSTETYIAAHHMLLSHASAARLYRKKYQEKQHGSIGFNLLTWAFYPKTNSSEDISAAHRAQDFQVGWFVNPFIFGDYPESMKKNVGSRLPVFTKWESDLVKGSIDFLGINFYIAYNVRNNPDSLKVKERRFSADMAAITEAVVIRNGSNSGIVIPGDQFPITPWILRDFLNSLKNIYGDFPIFIHENGQQTPRNSSLDDWSRVMYLQEFIRSVPDLLRNGHDVRGYFVWGFMDMYELLSGFESSYGLYYIDLEDPTLKRQPKLSAIWYSNFLNKRNMDPNITMEIEKNSLMLFNTSSMHKTS